MIRIQPDPNPENLHSSLNLGAVDPAPDVHPVRRVREGDGAVLRALHHMGRRVRQTSGKYLHSEHSENILK